MCLEMKYYSLTFSLSIHYPRRPYSRGGRFPPAFVCLCDFPNDISETVTARITKLDTEMVHNESWKSIHLGSMSRGIRNSTVVGLALLWVPAPSSCSGSHWFLVYSWNFIEQRNFTLTEFTHSSYWCFNTEQFSTHILISLQYIIHVSSPYLHFIITIWICQRMFSRPRVRRTRLPWLSMRAGTGARCAHILHRPVSQHDSGTPRHRDRIVLSVV